MSKDKQKTIGDNNGRENLDTDTMAQNGASSDITPIDLKSDSMFAALVKVSVKTLYYLLITLTVLAVFISQRFPFVAMKFYYDMEGYASGVKYAKKCAEKGDNNLAEALLYGIEMSESLLFESMPDQRQRYAEYLLYFTDKVALLPDSQFTDLCASQDKFYYDYYKNGKISPVAAAGLYSFKDYVYSKNTVARSVLGQTDKLLYSGSSSAEQGYITPDELKVYFEAIIDGDFDPNLEDLAVIFNQISENIVWGQGSLIYDAELEYVTILFYLLANVIKAPDVQNAYSYVDECLNIEDSIKKLYLVGAACTLGENLAVFFEKLGLKQEKQLVEEYFLVSVDGNPVALSDYFSLLSAKCLKLRSI